MSANQAALRQPTVCLSSALRLMREDAAADEHIVEQAQQGDVSAFEELYRMHVGKVFGLCLRMVADRLQAEELTQDVFVRAWQKLGTYRRQSLFSSWLHRVAVNVVLSHLRSRRRLLRGRVDFDDVEATEVAAAPPRAGGTVDLEKAIATLPPRARAVFLLFDVQGLRHDEIGELLRISEGTSKAHLHRARRMLREVLES